MEACIFEVGRPEGEFGKFVAAAADDARFAPDVQRPGGAWLGDGCFHGFKRHGEERIPLVAVAAALVAPRTIPRGAVLVVEGM